jgi:hypothetical protein
VVVWPHHFDLASLVTLSGSGEHATTIGLGFSPGDAGIDEPYFYVTPWPAPEAATLPALTIGRWNTEGWTGAVLRASQIIGAPDGTLRAEMLTTFLAEAHAAAYGVVRRG